MSASIRELDNLEEWIKEWDTFDEKLTNIKVCRYFIFFPNSFCVYN